MAELLGLLQGEERDLPRVVRVVCSATSPRCINVVNVLRKARLVRTFAEPFQYNWAFVPHVVRCVAIACKFSVALRKKRGNDTDRCSGRTGYDRLSFGQLTTPP